jgi:ribose transport system substrate-binding protein
VALTGCLVLSACGSSGGGSGKSAANTGGANTGSTQGQTGSSGGVSQAKLTELKAAVEKAKQVPAFVAPGPSVDVSAVKGKVAYAFPINNEIDTCNHQVATYAQLGKEFGMKVITFSNSGSPDQWATGVKNAIAAHADVLAMFCGIIPGAIGPQLQAAKKAGLKIIDGNYNETNDYTGLDAVTSVQTAEGMKSSVDAAVVALNGKPVHALVVTSSSVVQGPAAKAAVQSQVKADCPDVCTVEKTIDIPVQDWTSKTADQVSSALLANPKINTVFVAFDGMARFAVTAVQQAKRNDVKVYAWGTSASTVKTMVGNADGVLQADVGPSVAWDAYAEMDQTIRLLSGKPAATVDKEIVPNRFWTPDNASGFLTSSGGYNEEGYGGKAYQNAYRKLWGAPQL